VGRNPRGHRPPIFVMRVIKQSEAAGYIARLLIERGLNIPSQKLANQWLVFEYQSKQIGVDLKTGVWIREGEGDWRCLAKLCTVSGAIQAVGFLAKG
jgi:hypothetical protein